jgi:hypothetical protein
MSPRFTPARALFALSLIVLSCKGPDVVSNESGGAGGVNPGGAGGNGDRPRPHDAGAVTDGAARTDACVPLTCAPAGGHYCDMIGDGCGGQLDCGACPAGETCGGAGIEHVCGKPVDANCQAISCEQPGGRVCGRAGDGCGRALDCGSCPGGETCGASLPNVCSRGACENLCKQQMTCPAGQETTLTGTIFAPTPPRFGAADPLYNAVVYVPNAPLAQFPEGVSCEQCGAAVSGAPLVTTLTGADGKFVLRNVPAGDNIPLVIQLGRWRRTVTIKNVRACATTALDAETTRLPRRQSEGNIPRMAIATGTYDPIECLLRKIGIDDSEFTTPDRDGRVHFYPFGGARFQVGSPSTGDELVGKPQTLGRYDLVLFPCDDPDPKEGAALANLLDYTARGGRIFLTDFGYAWLRDMGALQSTVTWYPGLFASPLRLGNNFSPLIDQSFPKGKAFADWLSIVHASPTAGRLPVHDPYGGAAYVKAVVAPTQRWLYSDAPTISVQHFSFNTPIGAAPEKQCGRAVYSNFHVVPLGSDSGRQPKEPFPQHCGPDAPMSPQEKALEFMIFDAASCIQPDSARPRVFEPPPAPPPLPPPLIK